MLKLKLHTPETAPEEARPTLEAVRERFGTVFNLVAGMAECPPLLQAYMGVAQAFEATSLSPTERQVVLLEASRNNGCTYCVAAHSAVARMQKVDDAIVQGLRDGTELPDPRLEALRRFVRAVVNGRGWVDDTAKRAFLDAGYTPVQVMEVLVGIGQKTLSNYFNHLFGTPLDDVLAAHAWEAPGMSKA